MRTQISRILAHRRLGARGLALALALGAVAGGSAYAVPSQIPYSGRLTYLTSGAPFTGSVDIEAKLYGGPLTDTPIWVGATLLDQWVEAGALSFVLQGGTPALGSLDLEQTALWLELRVNEVTLTPRQQVLSVPFALMAADAQRLGGLAPDAFLLGGDNALVGNLTSTGSATLAGGLKVGNPSSWAECTPALVGAIRFDAVEGGLVLCDGDSWNRLLADGDVPPPSPGPWADTPVPGGIHFSAGNVGIGTDTPATTLDVVGGLRVRGGDGAGGIQSAECTAALESSLRWNATMKAFEFCDGVTWKVLGSGGGSGEGGGEGVSLSAEPVVVLSQDLPASTHGGTNVMNAWTLRPLNTEISDAWSQVTLSLGQFTLSPGTWLVEASQAYGAHIDVPMQFRSRLRNITDNKTEALSLICRSHLVSGNSSTLDCPLVGAFTISSPKTFALQYWASSVLTNVGLGMGSQDTSGEPVRVAQVVLRRVGEPTYCGQSSVSAAPSCAAVRTCGYTTSGAYWLDPDGNAGPQAPFQAWCDQDYDGGGWALIAFYANDRRISTFDTTKSQYATSAGGGVAPETFYPFPAGTDFGHMAYTRFEPANKQVMFTCGTTGNPTQNRYTSATLIGTWGNGDKGTYGTTGSPGWGHVSNHPSTVGRGYHWLCGSQAAHPQWGVAYCSGPSVATFSNHLASFNNQSGTQAIGCAGGEAARMMVWIR